MSAKRRLAAAPANETTWTLPEPEGGDTYGLLGDAYLAMETALAKRVLADDMKSGQRSPAHGYETLGQTSRESLWQRAREEAGLPRDAKFKHDLLRAALDAAALGRARPEPEVK